MVEDFKKELEKLLKTLEERLRNIRGYKLTKDFLNNLEVEVFNSRYALKSLGLITQIDPNTFRFEPFDVSYLSDIEISLKNRGHFSLSKERNSLIIKFPPLTEEVRKEIIKSLASLKEETRIKARQIRDDFLQKLKKSKDNREISEDSFFKEKEKIDKEIENFNKKVEEIFVLKEKEILG